MLCPCCVLAGGPNCGASRAHPMHTLHWMDTLLNSSNPRGKCCTVRQIPRSLVPLQPGFEHATGFREAHSQLVAKVAAADQGEVR